MFNIADRLYSLIRLYIDFEFLFFKKSTNFSWDLYFSTIFIAYFSRILSKGIQVVEPTMFKKK